MLFENLEEALLYKKLAGGAVECAACIRRCKIAPGKTGFCGSRLNENGVLNEPCPNIIVIDSEGTLGGKPVMHLKDAATGKTVSCCTPVVSVGGYRCNLDCEECPNPAMSHPERRDVAKAMFIAPQEAVETAKEKGVKYICLTYDEFVPFPKTVAELAKLASAAGINTILVTNTTFTPEFIDLFHGSGGRIARVDLKAGLKSGNKFYRDYCNLCITENGRAITVEKILDSIKYAKEKGLHLEMQSAVAAEGGGHVNFSGDAEVRETAEWIRHNLGAYVPWYLTLLRMKGKAPKPGDWEMVKRFAEVAKSAGLKNVRVIEKMCDCREEAKFGAATKAGYCK